MHVLFLWARPSVCWVALLCEYWELHNTSNWEFVTTCAFAFVISTWRWNWRREQTSNSLWNLENLEYRILKWYSVYMELRPWVVQGVLSGTHTSRDSKQLENDKKSGWPSTSSTPENVETIWWLVHEDGQRTNKDIAEIITVSNGTV